MSTPSPYRPGFATQPPLLAGRQHLLQLVETAVRTSGNRRQSFQVLYGPRGVGKTVLLGDRDGTPVGCGASRGPLTR